MPNDVSRVQIEFTLEFKRNLDTLAKKYRHIRSDIQPVIGQLEDGIFVGNRITGASSVVFKVRVKNSDIAKGKRSGYRLINELKNPRQVVLVTIYSKPDQSDIAAGKIRQILTEFEKGKE